MSTFSVPHLTHFPFRNVLGSGFVNDRVDIKQLALLVRNADYSPRVYRVLAAEKCLYDCMNVLMRELNWLLQGFNALVMRFQAPRATVLVYRSGKVRCFLLLRW